MGGNHRIIQITYALLFVIITISAFTLSYLNLMQAATDAEIYPAWMWPLCLDAFIIMGSLFVLQANLNQEPSWQGWIVLLTFTVASTVFNILHSPDDHISQAAHALAPIALCGSLEMLMIRIKRDLLRSSLDPEPTPEQQIAISSEKRDRVLKWYTDNPDGNTDQARKALRMSWNTVREIETVLMKSGELKRAE